MDCTDWVTLARPASCLWQLAQCVQAVSRWGKKGVWKRLLEQVSDDIDLEQLLLDSRIIRVHQHGAGAKKRRASGHRSLAWWIDHQDSFSG